MVLSPRQIARKKFPYHEAFYSELQSFNFLEKELPVYRNLICSGSTRETALVKMRLSEIPPTGAENYSNLQKVWEQQKMHSIKEFLFELFLFEPKLSRKW